MFWWSQISFVKEMVLLWKEWKLHVNIPSTCMEVFTSGCVCACLFWGKGVIQEKKKKECGGKCLREPNEAPTERLFFRLKPEHSVGVHTGLGGVAGTVWSCLWKYMRQTHITHVRLVTACVRLFQSKHFPAPPLLFLSHTSLLWKK